MSTCCDGPDRPTCLGLQWTQLRNLATTGMELHAGGSDHSGCFFHDVSIEQVHGAFGVAGIARVVGDHADGGSVAMQLPQQLHHRFAMVGVQVSGWLVCQQKWKDFPPAPARPPRAVVVRPPVARDSVSSDAPCPRVRALLARAFCARPSPSRDRSAAAPRFRTPSGWQSGGTLGRWTRSRGCECANVRLGSAGSPASRSASTPLRWVNRADRGWKAGWICRTPRVRQWRRTRSAGFPDGVRICPPMATEPTTNSKMNNNGKRNVCAFGYSA